LGEASDQLGFSVAGLPDIDSDGTPDIAAGAPNADNIDGFDSGGVIVFSGADGSVIRRLTDPAGESGDLLGRRVALLGDVDLDGVPDIAAGAPYDDGARGIDMGSVVLFSGADGSIIRKIFELTGSNNDFFGEAVSGIEDVNGDAVPDLVVGVLRDNGLVTQSGSLQVYSGADGTRILRILDPQAEDYDRLGSAVASLPDLTGDDIPEIVGAAVAHDVGGVGNAGQLIVFSGADGSVVRRLSDPAAESQDNLGDSIAVLPDVSGDGEPELIAGVRNDEFNPSLSSTGKVVVFSFDSDCDGDGFVPLADCDSASGDTYPGAPDICDGLANDCDAVDWPVLADIDRDRVEDFCDVCPDDADPLQRDTDGDGYGNRCDNCRGLNHADQTDSDSDGLGDVCDNCASDANPGQGDADSDGTGDACDTDADNDGVSSGDNCPTAPNPSQADADSDGLGDACDNCALDANADQLDTDHDEIGDVCDDCTDSDGDGEGDPGFPANTCPDDACPYSTFGDRDSDGVCDNDDNCPYDPNAPLDCDSDGGTPDEQCDNDGDGVGNDCDICPDNVDPGQYDFDGDGVGDACDSDADGDGTPNAADTDQDGDGVPEDDGDGMSDPCPSGVRIACDDNCPLTRNRFQLDQDNDGAGDRCDFDDGLVVGSGASEGAGGGGTRMAKDASGSGYQLQWLPETGALGYNVYRGLLSELSAFDYGSCFRSGLTATLTGVPNEPPPGDGFFYLITVELPTGEGSLGSDSDGVERPLVQSCP
jgi:hypothetical protein